MKLTKEEKEQIERDRKREQDKKDEAQFIEYYDNVYCSEW